MNIDELLPKVKGVELEILGVIDNFCKENNLRYSLAYGTLIGAIRHKGFIPWDDDIDIWMPREDYDKFISLWLENPVEGYVIQNTDLEPDFTQNFTKIRKDNTAFIEDEPEKSRKHHKGVFVDIFPLDGVAEMTLEFKIQALCDKFRMLFCRGYIPTKGSRVEKAISKLILTIVPHKLNNKVRLFFEKIVIRLGQSGEERVANFSDIKGVYRHYPSDLMDNLIETEFESKCFTITAKWDEVLRIQYGDYMELPPKEERTWKHHPLLIDLEHNYEDIVN